MDKVKMWLQRAEEIRFAATLVHTADANQFLLASAQVWEDMARDRRRVLSMSPKLADVVAIERTPPTAFGTVGEKLTQQVQNAEPQVKTDPSKVKVFRPRPFGVNGRNVLRLDRRPMQDANSRGRSHNDQGRQGD